ncbi:hypothetical protein SDC9_142223 [bioreactor metagenome]|uniref:Uncharacterized protein n=1 Tax=bioreactor metagenome TaxID=1076179 RepID=A0A645E3D1_9ZZZZ
MQMVGRKQKDGDNGRIFEHFPVIGRNFGRRIALLKFLPIFRIDVHAERHLPAVVRAMRAVDQITAVAQADHADFMRFHESSFWIWFAFYL